MVAVSLLLTCVVLVTVRSVASVPLPLFIPFGPDYGDTELAQGNSVSVTVTLQQPIPFLALSTNSITVETDGRLVLISGSASASVYAFSADADTTGIGHVFYRESSEPNVLSRVRELSDTGFSGSVNLTHAFIATWFYVGYDDNHDDLTNTFQSVLATDGQRTFAVLLYADNLIQWMTGDSNGGVNGFGGDRADVGFIGDDPSNVFFLPASNTSDVLNLDSTTNVGFGGVWIFEVGGSSVESPTVDECALGLNNCDTNAECVDLLDSFLCQCLHGYTGDGVSCIDVGSGSGSGSGYSSGSGSGTVPTDFCRGVFDGCCVESSNTSSDCVVNVEALMVNCSCSQSCFELGDCCPDILIASCFPEITVSFSAAETSAAENESMVNVNVDVSGFFPDPLVVQPGLSSYFVFYTRDGTAEAPGDYDGTIQIVEFSAAGQQRIEVSINDDQIVEGVEFLTAHITAGDTFVSVGLQDTIIRVIDDDVVTVALDQLSYDVSESEGSVEVCVGLSTGQLARDLVVTLSTQSGSAEAYTDYTPVSMNLTLSADVGVACVNISVLADGLVEKEEMFGIVLSSLDPAVSLSSEPTPVTVTDSDGLTVSFDQAIYFVSEASGSLEVCASITQGQLAPSRLAVVQVTTEDGTAVSGVDYGSVNVSLTFTDVVSTQCINITLIMDDLEEPIETLTVALSTDDSAITLDLDTATVELLDSNSLIISLEQSAYTVSEAEGMVEVCAVVTQGMLAPGHSVSVQLSTVEGTATEDLDYSSVSSSLSLSAPTTRQCANITILADGLVEPDEMFSVNLTTVSSDVIIITSMADVTIIDSDRVTISLEQSVYTVSEAEGMVEVCAVVTQGMLDHFVSVQLSTMDGSAVADSDYSSVNSALLFSASTTRDCANVTILADGLVEPDEMFSIILINTSPDVILNVSMGSVTIVDSDRVTISLEQSAYTVSEAEGAVEVCAVVTQGMLDHFVSVQLSTMDGSAVAGSDYSSVNSALLFSASTTRDCASVTILADGVVEPDEMFSINLINTSPDVILNAFMASVTIVDLERVTISLEQSAYTVSEAEGMVEVCAVVTQGMLAPGHSVSVQLSTVEGTATEDLDYSSVSSSLSLSASNTRQCANITILADGLVESDEMFSVNLTTVSSDVIITTSMANVTIIDSDRVTISLEQSVYTVSEAEGMVEVCAVVTQGMLDHFVSVQLSTMDGSAVAGSDYSSVNSALLFSASTTRDCANVTIQADGLVEPDEMFSINLINTSPDVSLNVSMATVAVINVDRVTISLEQSAYTVREAEGMVEVCAVVTQGMLAPGHSVSVQLSSMDGTAVASSDYSSVSSSLSLSASNTRQCASITVFLDGRVEPEESFSVELDSSDLSVIIGLPAAVNLTDSDVVNVFFAQSSYTVFESDPSVELCLQVNGSALDRAVTVVVMTNETGSAQAGEDFTSAVLPVTFDLSPSEMCVNVVILGDSLFESAESFDVVLDQPEPLGVVFVPPSVTTVIIEDGAAADCSFQFIQSSYSGAEDSGFFAVCVQLNGVTTAITSVLFSTRDGTAIAGEDYTANTERVTFDPSTFGIAVECPRVVFTDDSIPELDESFFVDLSAPQGGCSIVDPSATVTIFASDGDIPPTVSFEQLQYSVSEAGGAIEVCVTLNQSPPAGQTLSVNYETVNGTAIAGEDFEDKVGVFTFTATSLLRQCVTIGILNDVVFEPDETFSVLLSQPSPGLVVPQTTAVVSITNDDPPPVTISLEEVQYSVSEESGSVMVCLVVSEGAVQEPISVTVSTADVSATAGSDYEALMATLTFQPGGAERLCVNITILDDSTQEGLESFTVSLSSDPFSGSFGPPATVMITDTVDGTLVVTFDLLSYSYPENANPDVVMVCVDLMDNAVTRTVDVQLTLRDGTAVAGEDYVNETAVVRFDPMNAQAIICERIALIDDSVHEPSETFFADLSTADPAVVFQARTAAITILNDDPPVVVGFSAPSFSILEGELPPHAPAMAEVCVDITGSFSGQLSFTISTTPDTAGDGVDYVGGNTTVTFTAGGLTTQCVRYNISGDNLFEPIEQFIVTLSVGGQFVGVSRGTANVIIVDDDFSPEIVLINDTPAVAMDNATSASVRVDFTLRTDVASATCQLFDVFGPRDCSQGTVTFSGLDPQRQRPFTFIVTAFNSSGAVLANITRQVRLGFNLDCSVVFVNAGEDDLLVVDQFGFVRVEWEERGPVDFTDCRLEVNGVRQQFQICTSPYIIGNLDPGEYAVKVRPNGDSCSRRIRRTVTFTVE